MRHNLIPLSDLNLTDRFLFDEVMEDSQAHQDALSIIFGHPVPLLGKNETEKELRVSPAIRSVRMDVFSMDEEKSIYNCYTFRPRCEEQPDCILDDGTARIFLNTRGTNDSEVSKELADFLHYLEETTDEAAESSGSDRIRRIHDRVCKVKSNEESGVKYMQAWEEKYYERQEGLEEGLRRGLEKGSILKLIQLITKKLEKGKTLAAIADELEEDLSSVTAICNAAEKYAPAYDCESIYEELCNTNKEEI